MVWENKELQFQQKRIKQVIHLQYQTIIIK
jgi:hypothetical protein